ncbi:MAG: insulinase family protein [Planctomycetes bacterium]|nr:insulinase family protein [Planctomycetota bacterium]
MNHSYQKTTLPNGLRLIKLRMPAVHSVVVSMYVKCGPRFEAPAQSGINHFVEHMLFKGTATYPNSRAISEAADNIGADINGGTLPEYSEYSLIVHPRHLDEGLRIFADFVCNSVFDAREIDNEKQIIAEELSQYRDVAGDSVNLDELSYDLMWPAKSTPYSALGTDETITSFTRDQLARHYRKYYVPSNMVLSIAGNFDHDRIDALAEETFGGLSGAVEIAQPECENNLHFPRMFFRKMPTRVDHIKLCQAACSYRDPNLTAVLIVCDVLGGGPSSRLFSTLREEQGLVYDVSAGAALYSNVGSIDVVTSTNRYKLLPTLECILEQIRILREEGISQHELARVKDRVACQMDFLLDSPMDLNEWFGVREILTSPEKFETPADEMERLREVSTEDVNRVIREYLVPARRGLVVIGASSWRQRRRAAKLLAEE